MQGSMSSHNSRIQEFFTGGTLFSSTSCKPSRLVVVCRRVHVHVCAHANMLECGGLPCLLLLSLIIFLLFCFCILFLFLKGLSMLLFPLVVPLLLPSRFLSLVLVAKLQYFNPHPIVASTKELTPKTASQGEARGRPLEQTPARRKGEGGSSPAVSRELRLGAGHESVPSPKPRNEPSGARRRFGSGRRQAG